MIAAGLLLLLVQTTSAQQGADVPLASSQDLRARDVEATPDYDRKCLDNAPIQQINPRQKPATTIEQLPPTVDLPPEASAPESSLEKTAPKSPRAGLYDEVAMAWEVIRKRGQQPTPELIAREIGPDVLARFLNQFPGAETIFGRDSDTLPYAPPRPEPEIRMPEAP